MARRATDQHPRCSGVGADLLAQQLIQSIVVLTLTKCQLMRFGAGGFPFLTGVFRPRLQNFATNIGVVAVRSLAQGELMEERSSAQGLGGMPIHLGRKHNLEELFALFIRERGKTFAEAAGAGEDIDYFDRHGTGIAPCGTCQDGITGRQSQ
ncbi:hypothetical protein ABB25_06980 [Stenotrophomonas koreensis]|uniref:Uncharacterized protein n=1 Tax=Stenotrophomonas koreensis TaxID=266128 RepID=A0A0R0BXY7_9GAMM|nr:hypothetical protein ABB25_06980 [Stenotrophomonas koreensis]